MVITTRKSDVRDDIGLCLIVTLFEQRWIVTVHIALNVVLKCQYFSQLVDFLEHPGMRFHIRSFSGFTVLLTVIFLNSS